MKRFSRLFTAGLVAALALTGCDDDDEDATQFSATLNSANERGDNTSNPDGDATGESQGTGTATATVDPDTRTVTVSANFTGLSSNATDVHIHGPVLTDPPEQGAAGVLNNANPPAGATRCGFQQSLPGFQAGVAGGGLAQNGATAGSVSGSAE